MALEMQREEWTDPGQGLYLPGCPTGVGGNRTLINQDEDDILPMSWENVPCEETGYAENVSTTQGVYRREAYREIPYDRGASPQQMASERAHRAEEAGYGY